MSATGSIIGSVSSETVRDLPTTQALVRLRLLAEDAARRADDTSEAGRHQAVIALDGACEHALWLATRACGIQLTERQRGSVPALQRAVREQRPDWRIEGWPGVNQMHDGRNAAQHSGVTPPLEQVPAWRDATLAFVDSLCREAFQTKLEDIVLADAVRDGELRTALRWAEEQITVNATQSFILSVSAFDTARAKWREQHNVRVFNLAPDGYPDIAPAEAPFREIEDLLEVQAFAGDFSQYTWLRRACEEQERAGWAPSRDDARRALAFVSGWIVRWEIFDRGYPVDRWEDHRDSVQPPTDGDGTVKILWAQAEFLPGVPGRPARNVIYFQLANVPGRGRSPWDALLGTALEELAREAIDVGPLFLGVQWTLTGFLIVPVALDANPELVSDVVQRAVELAGHRYAEYLTESEERELQRQTLQFELRDLIRSTRTQGVALFGEVEIVPDTLFGTPGWIAVLKLDLHNGDVNELNDTHRSFMNQTGFFPHLSQRDRSIAFAIGAMTGELREALQLAITGAEQQVGHVRGFRARETETYVGFARAIRDRFGPDPMSSEGQALQAEEPE
jgi:hypothetical protein